MKKLILASLLIAVAACASDDSATKTQTPAKRTATVKAVK